MDRLLADGGEEEEGEEEEVRRRIAIDDHEVSNTVVSDDANQEIDGDDHKDDDDSGLRHGSVVFKDAQGGDLPPPEKFTRREAGFRPTLLHPFKILHSLFKVRRP
jgi:hypothetical protein